MKKVLLVLIRFRCAVTIVPTGAERFAAVFVKENVMQENSRALDSSEDSMEISLADEAPRGYLPERNREWFFTVQYASRVSLSLTDCP